VSAIDDRLREELDALLDGALPEDQAAALRARIEQDADVRAEYERRRRTVELVRALPLERPAEDFVAQTMARLPVSAAPRRNPLIFWVGGLAAAAAIMLAFFFDEDAPRSYTEATGSSERQLDSKPEGSLGEPVPASVRRKEVFEKTAKQDAAPQDRDLGALVGEKKERERAAGGVADASEPAEERKAKDRATEADFEEAEETIDADEEMDDAGMGSPAGAPKLGKSVPKSSRSRDATTLVRQVEQRPTVLSPADRALYLAALGRLDDKALLAHFTKVGAGDRIPLDRLRREQGQLAGAAGARLAAGRERGIVFDLTVTKRAEAETIRTLLARAYGAKPADKRRAKNGSRGSVAPAAGVADRVGKDGGQLSLDCALTPREAGAFAAWIERLNLRRTAPAQTPSPGAVRIEESRSDAAKKKAQPVPIPVVVRIKFGQPKPRPERPKSEDK